MNEFLDLSKSLNLSYVYLHNGLIKETNVNNLKDLNITKDLNIVLIHDIDSDADINITLNDNLNLNVIELFKVNKLTKDITVNKNITLGANSHIELVTIEYDEAKELQEYNMVFNLNTKLYENSNLDSSKIVVFNSKYTTNELTDLIDENSILSNFNVFINYTNNKQLVNSKVSHLAKDTTSTMRNYGISKYKSELVLNTNGYIMNGAKRSNVSQKNTGLLVDLESKISASPWLQIDEYDCLASHGAGIGAIDEEAMYYLMSRGLTKTESEKLIVGGFVTPIYAKIENEKILEKVTNIVNKYL